MTQRPDNICQLKKNLFVGTQKDFVETFNWVAQTVANMEGGTNCTIEWPMPDHPVINAQIAEDYDGYKEFNEGSGGCSCDLVPTLSSGTKIADWTKDGTNYTSIYSPSDVVSFTGTDNSSTVKAGAFTFQSASDSNIVITCSGNVITVGAYYL